jgi:hypothetical protein
MMTPKFRWDENGLGKGQRRKDDTIVGSGLDCIFFLFFSFHFLFTYTHTALAFSPFVVYKAGLIIKLDLSSFPLAHCLSSNR